MSAVLLPAAASVLGRRDFLKAMGAGLVLAVSPVGRVFAAGEEKFGADAMPHGAVDDPLAFVSIAEDGTVTITAHRAEMGQGIRSSLPMVVADEMGADWARVRVVQAPGDEVRYGNQNTDGSRSLRHFLEPMRRVGAAARQMLEAAAAARWAVPVAEVRAGVHEVSHPPTGRRLGYGELARAAAALPVPAAAELRLKSPAEFRYIGKGAAKDSPSADVADIVHGRAVYGLDARLPGMLFAVVARPPVLGGRLRRYDAAETLKVPGVVRVVELESHPLPPLFHPLGGVAVVARDTWSAIKGREALKIEWEDDVGGVHAAYDSAAYRKELEAAARRPAKAVRSDGDAPARLAAAKRKVVAEYYIPHHAHATMEPPNATAWRKDGRWEIWAPVQNPQEARDNAAGRLGVGSDAVTLNVTLLGGAFGRKAKSDFVSEAALVSLALDGAPVQVAWTREDDLRHGYYHTVSLEHLEAELDDKGRPTAWLHRTVAPSITSTFAAGAKSQAPFEYGMTAVNVPFPIPDLRIEVGEAEAHTRIGWFRSVYNIPHAFAVQSFVAELAAAAKRDAKDYLLELIGPPRRLNPRDLGDAWNYQESPQRYPVDTGRMARVVELAAAKARWGRKLPKGHGLGIAVAYSFVSYVATVIEVAVDAKGGFRIVGVDTAVDCGPQINPDRIRSQAEGASVMGLSLAAFTELSFKDGKVVQGNFDDYPVARIGEAPKEVRVHLVPNDFAVPPGGMGEPALPPVAPALCNALFAATGKRIRSLPIGDQLRRSAGGMSAG